MTKPDEWFERLAARARLTTPPGVDVTDSVGDIISRAEADMSTPAPGTALFLSATAAATGILLFLASRVWNSWSDPLVQAVIELTWEVL